MIVLAEVWRIGKSAGIQTEGAAVAQRQVGEREQCVRRTSWLLQIHIGAAKIDDRLCNVFLVRGAQRPGLEAADDLDRSEKRERRCAELVRVLLEIDGRDFLVSRQ